MQVFQVSFLAFMLLCLLRPDFMPHTGAQQQNTGFSSTVRRCCVSQETLRCHADRELWQPKNMNKTWKLEPAGRPIRVRRVCCSYSSGLRRGCYKFRRHSLWYWTLGYCMEAWLELWLHNPMLKPITKNNKFRENQTTQSRIICIVWWIVNNVRAHRKPITYGR